MVESEFLKYVYSLGILSGFELGNTFLLWSYKKADKNLCQISKCYSCMLHWDFPTKLIAKLNSIYYNCTHAETDISDDV